MAYLKTVNLLDNTPSESSKFSIKHWVKMNDVASGTYNTNSQTKLKTTVIKLSLCDYNGLYLLVKETITKYLRTSNYY